MNKLQPNRLNVGINKWENTDNKMILLNLISQEHNKYIHYRIERDKFKSVLKDLSKNPQEINESSESQELQESQEIYESSSNFEIKKWNRTNRKSFRTWYYIWKKRIGWNNILSRSAKIKNNF